MHFAVIQRIIGQFLMLFSITLLPPILIDFIYSENAFFAFFYSALFLFSIGFILFLLAGNPKGDLRLRDGFVVVVMFWFVLGAAGAIPFYLSQDLNISLIDALFESVSGLTTTGATVLIGLDNLPHGILFYRQELQWLGGLGIIVLAVAVMPMLGVGGMQLYKAEAHGVGVEAKDSKLTPRIAETAKALWYIYLGLTVMCAIAYWLAGMNFFNAISHSFSTVAIGGFSTHDASLGYFDNQWIEIVAIIFMFLGAINFALHFTVLRPLWGTRKALGKDDNISGLKKFRLKLHAILLILLSRPRQYLKDAEFKFYAILLILISLLCTYVLYDQSSDYELSSAARDAIFHTVSIATTSGFSTTDFASWPVFIPVVLIFSSFVGGCTGSTGGGMKVIRVLLLIKQGQREIIRLIHPNAQVAVKIGKVPVNNAVIDAVWGFFAAYVGLFVLMMLILMFNGLDQVTAFSAIAATINNLGPGLGEVSDNYGSLSDFNKGLLCFSMFLGRLEIFALLVLLTPAFWRK